MKHKKHKKQHHEEHVDETWLLPYSDMLTLLLALFIVMFAMSKVDNQKFQQMSQQFNIIFEGGSGVMQSDGNSALPANLVGSSGKIDGKLEQDRMAYIKQTLEEEIKKNGYEGRIAVQLNGEGLEISIQDTVAFNSGEAEIVTQFYPLLSDISYMLKKLDNDIRVAGHTDNVPIFNSKFRSNWDLSYMRAANVMRFMVSDGQLAENKFSIQAYGEYKPKYSNSSVEGRARNRRVDILIVRKYPVDNKE